MDRTYSAEHQSHAGRESNQAECLAALSLTGHPLSKNRRLAMRVLRPNIARYAEVPREVGNLIFFFLPVKALAILNLWQLTFSNVGSSTKLRMEKVE